MPPEDYKNFHRFLAEAGDFEIPRIWQVEDADLWYNPDLESREMAIRAAARNAALEELGYKGEDLIEWEDVVEPLDSHPILKEMLGTPDFIHYKWHDVSVKNYGSLSGLQKMGEAVVDARQGVVLFADEVQRLVGGESVTTFHSSGFQTMGFLAERKDVYKIVDGNLQRVRGVIID